MASSSKKIAKEFYNLRKNLLDLTLRNQLLNFKPRNKTLTISASLATENRSGVVIFGTLGKNRKYITLNINQTV